MDKDRNGHIFTLAENVSTSWRIIGYRINMTQNVLDTYDQQFSRDSNRCWEKVMQIWIDGSNLKEYPVSWKGLYKILTDIGKPKVAEDLKTAVEKAY